MSNANRRIGDAGRSGRSPEARGRHRRRGVLPCLRTRRWSASFDEIAGNIRRGYSIGYVPTNASHDGGFRRVKVMVLVPGRNNLSVRTRDGYRTSDHARAR